jgi:hypothetical protein
VPGVLPERRHVRRAIPDADHGAHSCRPRTLQAVACDLRGVASGRARGSRVERRGQRDSRALASTAIPSSLMPAILLHALSSAS